jgi:hypothetical protein
VAEVLAGDARALVRVAGVRWPEETIPLDIRVYGSDGALLVEAPPSAAEISVVGLRNGTEHLLKVRLAAQSAEGWVVESGDVTVAVTPVDHTPPVPPADVLAIRAENGVRLRWLPSGGEPYSEVAVLRAEGRGRPLELIRLTGDTVSYLDTSVRRGSEYKYFLVTLDAEGNRSLPTREARIRVR